jgi:hypothetical protein
VIPASVERVWSIVRDFNALPVWLPAAVASEIEGGKDPAMVGCVRRAIAADQSAVREMLTELSDADHRCSYALLSAPYPMRNYTATFQLYPVTDTGHCYMTWFGTFDVDSDKEQGTIQFVGENIYNSAFARLKQLVSVQSDHGSRSESLHGTPSRSVGGESALLRIGTEPTEFGREHEAAYLAAARIVYACLRERFLMAAIAPLGR